MIHKANNMETASDLSPTPITTASLDSQRSATKLRFPTPLSDSRITTWVESQSATMSASSENAGYESHLSESAYEFIDTDEESREGDDNATESVASTDFGRPDDVASLADTEHSGEESGDEEEESRETSSIPAFPGLDQSMNNAFSTPTIGRSSAVFLEDIDKPLAQSIEFEEPYSSLGAENISVKHTIADYNEEQTAVIVKDMAIHNPPKRLVVTVRQTMTKQGLSTREPLRILYVGSHSAKQDIIHKIASSVTASVDSGKRVHHHSTSQLYNVVPVSAFGSERTPEIELMHSSGYQIKVEDCTFAQNLKYEDEPGKPDVVKLTLEDNFSYHSVPDNDTFIVEPQWELPHVVIFYCSDSDDTDARRTRTIARKFMSRHAIPSIVISHKQLFSKGHCMSLDQHAIHMCLESRDPNGRGNIIHQRLPIDLASFLNIDARQMNRNLAYITGLHEPQEASTPPLTTNKSDKSLTDTQSQTASLPHVRTRNMPELRALLPTAFLLLSVFAAVFTGIPNYRFASAPAISINSKVMSAVPISTASVTPSALTPSITSTHSSVVIPTSTRTVTVTQSQAPGPNSLAIMPSMELGKISQVMHNLAKSANKSSLCTAEILGDREILIRIPSATKLSWLTKEAMSVNISRGNTTVDTERAYSSDEGIVLLLAKKEAFGVLNISIVTTRKPRVNETFQVDFGMTPLQTLQDYADKLMAFFKEDAVVVDSETIVEMRTTAEKLLKDAHESSQQTLAILEGARKATLQMVSSLTSDLAASAKQMSVEAAKRSATISHEIGTQLAELEKAFSDRLRSLGRLPEPLEDGLLKAQVRSKLLWLKLQGKDAEYRDYEQRATAASVLKSKSYKQSQREARKAEKEAAKQQKKDNWAARKAAKKDASAVKKGGIKPSKKV